MFLVGILLPFLSLAYCDFVPVVIWGNGIERTPQPTDFQISESTFQSLVDTWAAKRPDIFLFLEQNLSVEDFSNDLSTYPYLQEISKKREEFMYLNAVENPVNVINGFQNFNYSGEVRRKDAQGENIPRIIKVGFGEERAGLTRQAFLHDNDQEMNEITEDPAHKSKTFLAIYTGLNTIPRHKREAEEEEIVLPNDIVMTDSDKTILVVTGGPIVLRTKNEVYNLSQVIYASTETNKKPYIALDVKFKEEEMSLDLVFNSPSENHAWTLETIRVENWDVELRTRVKISAPASYSYFCAQDIVFTGTKDEEEISLTLKGLQAQPRVSNNAFGPASDCIPYFSEPILSGIMIMTLLIIVAMIAILLILGIQANDKFDDPKGKILTISSTE